MENKTNASYYEYLCELNSLEKRIFVANIAYRKSVDIVCILICIFGIVGNILAYLVIRMAKQSSMTFLLKALAIADISFLLALMNLTISFLLKIVTTGAWNPRLNVSTRMLF